MRVADAGSLYCQSFVACIIATATHLVLRPTNTIVAVGSSLQTDTYIYQFQRDFSTGTDISSEMDFGKATSAEERANFVLVLHCSERDGVEMN